MLYLKNIITPDGKTSDHTIESDQEHVIDGEGRLMVLPALIDPHVHFRTPGAEYKENWLFAAKAALAGGVTTVCDMPNNTPSCITPERLDEKHALIQQQLESAGVPLRYGLYYGADKRHLSTIAQVTESAVALKIFMGSSTGDLLMDDPVALDEAFKVAAAANLPVAVHAEDEARLQERTSKYAGSTDPATHSLIRDPQAAVNALSLAISLAEKYGTRLYALHLSTADEMDLIRKGKAKGVDLYAETTPHHLFLDTADYATLGTRAQMNPPLRNPEHHEALWAAIADGTIDTIGSDHAPHTLEEKDQPYPKAPSGVPGIETLLPLLLNAHHQGKLSLDRLQQLTRWKAEELFRLTTHNDVVLVDLEKKQTVTHDLMKSRSAWTPFAGQELTGWPIYTILKGKAYHVNTMQSAALVV